MVSVGEAGDAVASPPEMDQTHRERVCKLLFETGRSPGMVTQDVFIAAYNAVLAKETLWILNELLIYRQNEVHR